MTEEGTASANRGRDSHDREWMALALSLCFAYGLLLIALIHTTADGSWFWYANALRGGQRLYGDLHLPLQPMYPIELAGFQRVFGITWLAQQSVGLANLALFLFALTLVARRADLVAWQRALLLCCSFVTCMAFIMMRFDDFHVIATSMELLCAGLLLKLTGQLSSTRRTAVQTALGLLCGTCMLLRINDGAFLLGVVTFIGLFVARTISERLSNLLIIPCVAAAVILAVIAAMGESARDWWFYSIHTAAAIKGGSLHLLLYPLRLPFGTLSEFSRDWRTLALAVYTLVIGGAAWTLPTNTYK